jgi:hypothetical protein
MARGKGRLSCRIRKTGKVYAGGYELYRKLFADLAGML